MFPEKVSGLPPALRRALPGQDHLLHNGAFNDVFRIDFVDPVVRVSLEHRHSTLNAQTHHLYALSANGEISALKSDDADGFNYPVGPRNLPPVTPTADGDGWFNAQDFAAPNSLVRPQAGPLLHPGEDWNAEAGQDSDIGAPVYAVSNGEVTAIRHLGAAGDLLVLRHGLPGGSTVYSIYLHIAVSPDLALDSPVERDQQVGEIADIRASGLSPHLHFEIRTKAVAPNDLYASDFDNSGYYALEVALKTDGLTIDPSDYLDANVLGPPVVDGSVRDGVLPDVKDGIPDQIVDGSIVQVLNVPSFEDRGIIEFDISKLRLPIPQTVLTMDRFAANGPFPLRVEVFGYSGDGRLSLDDFGGGSFLNSFDYANEAVVRVDVTQFIASLVSSGERFAGFNLRADLSHIDLNGPFVAFDSLEVTRSGRRAGLTNGLQPLQHVAVNELLTGIVIPGSTVFNPSPAPGAPAGTFSLVARFCRQGGAEPIRALKSITTFLTGGNVVLNRDGGTPPNGGSEMTFPVVTNSNFTLDHGECVAVPYTIGLATRAKFVFLVDVTGFVD